MYAPNVVLVCRFVCVLEGSAVGTGLKQMPPCYFHHHHQLLRIYHNHFYHHTTSTIEFLIPCVHRYTISTTDRLSFAITATTTASVASATTATHVLLPVSRFSVSLFPCFPVFLPCNHPFADQIRLWSVLSTS
jgi:hypothetical protein